MSLHRELPSTLDFSRRLIRVPSTADNPKARLQVLDMASERLDGFSSIEFVSNGKVSRLYYNTPELPKNFRVILNAHMDVVNVEPDNEHQFEPTTRGRRLYGRGSADMKAAGAVQIDVFRKLAKKVNYPLGLMLVTDEEVGGADGTGYQVKQGVRSDFVIAGEPTNLQICHKMKGRLGVGVMIDSLSAHAAYPDKVDAATDELAEFMIGTRMWYPKPTKDNWQTTASFTDLRTSNSGRRPWREIPNTIPAEASASVDVRYIPEDDPEGVLANLRSVAGPNTAIEVFQSIPAAYTKPTHPDVVSLQNALSETLGTEQPFAVRHGSCDFRWFTDPEVGGAGVALGPIGADSHGEHEYVEIDSLVQYEAVLTKFLRSLGQ